MSGAEAASGSLESSSVTFPLTPALSLREREKQRPGSRFKVQGFTVIELVGVLAIIAIIAAALAPNIIRRIDRAAWQREVADLDTMAKGFTRTILTDKAIPATNGISDTIAKYLDRSISQVKTNARGFSRVFMTDPSLNVGGSNLRTVAYAQSDTGSSNRPVNVRVVILSAIGGPSLAGISDSFSTIWDLPAGGKPSTWGGKADDFCMQRVDLGPLFYKLYLLNQDKDPSHNGYYSIDLNAPDVPVAPQGTSFVGYFLKGTGVKLYAAGADPANLQMQLIVRQDESYLYQNDQWNGVLVDQSTFDMPQYSFGWWINEFLKHPYRGEPWGSPLGTDPTGVPAKFGASQRAIVDEMYSYLRSYWSWATAPSGAFAGQNDSPGAQNPFFRTVDDAQGRLYTYTYNIINQ